MKLHEAFKEVEEMWEAASRPILKTFGKKTYDLSKRDELEAWVDANVEFQMKRHPNRYAPDNDGGMPNIYPLGKFNTYTVRSNVLNNLLDNIAKDDSTKEIRDHIWELITANAEDTSKKMTAFNRAKDAEAKTNASEADAGAPVEEAKAATRITKSELKEMIKEALREELASTAPITESTDFAPADEITSSSKYALAFAFYDYGWYWKAIDENKDGSTCTTTHHSDGKFYKDTVYTGRLYDSIESCIAEVEHNVEDYLQYTLPEKIDYVSGRKNGSIGVIELNAAFDGYADIIPIFNCKARKLVPTKK